MGLSSLEYSFSHADLLSQALTHRSFGAQNNERLEFLGDAILNCVIADALYRRFPGLREGELSRLRANLVRQDALVSIAQELELGAALRLGEGEMRSGGASRPSILADALEAVFGAVYLDAGFERARDVILSLYADALEAIDPAASGKDPKTALQEWLQGRKLPLPEYALMGVAGEAHQQIFEVECRIPRYQLVTLGKGQSRRAAEQQAAQLAFEALSAK